MPRSNIKNPGRLNLLRFLGCGLAIAAPAAHASIMTYLFIGQPAFDQFPGSSISNPYTSADSVSGQIQLDTAILPLPTAGLTDARAALTSFRFSDGVQTLSSSMGNSAQIARVSLDGNGVLSSFDLLFSNANGNLVGLYDYADPQSGAWTAMQFGLQFDSNGGYSAGNVSLANAGPVSIAPRPLPLPSSALLTVAGLAALLVGFKKRPLDVRVRHPEPLSGSTVHVRP